jgi:hypothetical protein
MSVAIHHVEVELRRVNDEMVVKVVGYGMASRSLRPFSSATSVCLRSPIRAQALASCAESWIATL